MSDVRRPSPESGKKREPWDDDESSAAPPRKRPVVRTPAAPAEDDRAGRPYLGGCASWHRRKV